MNNIKFVSICASIGFILSLVCGFFSGSGFGRIFLIALLFGVIFGGLAFGISFVYGKFLDVEGSVEGVQVAQSDGVTAADNKKNLGQHVNIIIQEEELEPSGNKNHYDIGENHQMLNESDYNHNNSEDGDKPHIEERNEFVPIRNVETVTNFSGSESMTSEESEERRKIIAEQNSKKDDDLDVLPDMSDIQISSDTASPDAETVVISEAEESDYVPSASSSRASENAAGDIKDASLMAKAISSILSEES